MDSAKPPTSPMPPEGSAHTTLTGRELGRVAICMFIVALTPLAFFIAGMSSVFRERPDERTLRIVNSGALIGMTIPEAEKALRTPLHPSPTQPHEYDTVLAQGFGIAIVHVTTDGRVITQASTRID